MKEKPILFNGEMVKAILDGRKTQTRRVVKPPLNVDSTAYTRRSTHTPDGQVIVIGVTNDGREWGRRPYAEIGDRLWVRETWQRCLECGLTNWREGANSNGTICQHCDASLGKWKPSIHMPRQRSRITLEVTGVRVQRVQDITHDDAVAEGVRTGNWRKNEGKKRHPLWSCAFNRFVILWDSINAKRGYSWESNPWVWVVEFRRIKP